MKYYEPRSSKSFYAITWACGTCNLFYNSALPRNRTLYICCTKCDSFVELYVWCVVAAQRTSRPPHSWGFQITHNGTPSLVGLLWMSDRHVAVSSTWKHKTIITDNNLPAGFEPTISADELPQTYGLGRAATGIEIHWTYETELQAKKKHTKTHGHVKKIANPRSERKYIAFLA